MDSEEGGSVEVSNIMLEARVSSVRRNVTSIYLPQGLTGGFLGWLPRWCTPGLHGSQQRRRKTV
ncbi:hypothetical protein E2C01_009922 [Portunus trituberculatus]|uniref:Uncharacterized protein n=1 Tax=Portunus trituberculatus TaxID=210409 RepID=A0A5B7D7A3_PORTR|nr:hypothetical protein [Portunus trituberculatus]